MQSRALNPMVTALAIGGVLGVAAPARAQSTATLVKDINPGFLTSIPTMRPVVANGMYFFVTDDGVHGDELWRSDGTEAGTFLVKDINPGSGDGAPSMLGSGLLASGNTVYFTGAEPATGWELWKSDGTEAGTVLVKDINSVRSTDGSQPIYLYEANGKVFFSAVESKGGVQGGLYVSDGTASGTIRLVDAERLGGIGMDCARVGTLLYCSLDTLGTSSYSLYKTDGTVAGTSAVAPGSLGQLPTGLTASGNLLFYWASDPTHGRELWKSDGTASGTALVKDCAPGTTNSVGSTGYLGLYTAFDGGFLFSGSNGSGSFMWKTDGTEAGTVPVGTVLGSNVTVGFSWLTSRGPDVFFQGSESNTGSELWKTDGTASGTKMVLDINSGRSSGLNAQDLEFELAGSRLYFVANDGTHGFQVWRSDGTAANTVRLTNFVPNYARETRPRHIRRVGSKILFFADDALPGAKLWSLDLDAPPVSAGTAGSTGSGGTSGVGGMNNAGGSVTSGGSVGSGGAAIIASGGAMGNLGGATASGGTGTGVGTTAAGGQTTSTSNGGSSGATAGDDGKSSGCSCEMPGKRHSSSVTALVLSLLVLRRWGRRRMTTREQI